MREIFEPRSQEEFDRLYQTEPISYLLEALFYWMLTRGDLIEDTFEKISPTTWPLLLWIYGNQYVHRGGIRKFPETGGYEDGVLRHVSGLDRVDGPVRDQVEGFRSAGREAIEVMGTDQGRSEFLGQMREAIRHQVLAARVRFKRQLDEEDLVNELVVTLHGVIEKPWKIFTVGTKWKGSRYQPEMAFVRNVMSSMAAQKYGTNREIEKRSIGLDESWMSPVTVKEGSDDVKPRMTVGSVEDLFKMLPDAQREAVEVRLLAEMEGISQAEAARRMGKDPDKVEI